MNLFVGMSGIGVCVQNIVYETKQKENEKKSTQMCDIYRTKTNVIIYSKRCGQYLLWEFNLKLLVWLYDSGFDLAQAL